MTTRLSDTVLPGLVIDVVSLVPHALIDDELPGLVAWSGSV
jgi:hypothetical protein